MKNVFISYSWDNEEHKDWVMNLRNRLEADGVTTVIDRVDLPLGDSIPKFMEQSIRNADYILIVLTPEYKRKADNRIGGVGYEDSIITGEILNGQKKRVYIPILARGDWNTSTPTWLLGKNGVNLTGNPYSKNEYKKLLDFLLGRENNGAYVETPIMYSLSGKQVKIMMLLYGSNGKTASELATNTQNTVSSVNYQIRGLVKQGMVIKREAKYYLADFEDELPVQLLKSPL